MSIAELGIVETSAMPQIGNSACIGSTVMFGCMLCYPENVTATVSVSSWHAMLSSHIHRWQCTAANVICIPVERSMTCTANFLTIMHQSTSFAPATLH